MPSKASLKSELLKEQGYRCAICGKRKTASQLQLDRIIPGAWGGGYEPHNVQLACTKCNQSKGARLLPRG